MTAFANFRSMARGGQPVVERHSILPDTRSPGVSLTQLFQFQSYYDSTLLQKAILPQAVNEPIVGSTLQKSNIGGYTFGLHPSSQTPVAIQPLVGGQGASPQAIILSPGQIYRPYGRPGDVAGNFTGFNWGLPFGWLGGGIATLYVFPSPDADAAWTGHPEVLFHRQRIAIKQPGDLAGLGAAPLNWPLRFAWPNAVSGTNSVPQGGQAAISITDPTRVILSLRTNSLGAPADMRVIWQSDNDFDLDSTGAVILTTPRFVTTTWGTFAANGGGGNLATNFPVMELSGEICRIAADNGGVVFLDMSGGALNGLFVDVARYGKL
jgi:hypothetical protein